MEIDIVKGIGSEKSYLLHTRKGYILVDIGWPSTAKKILENYQNIYLIVITHRHYDHHGAAEYVKSETGAKIAAFDSPSKKTGEIPFLPATLVTLGINWIKQGCFIPGIEDLQIKIKLKSVDILLKENDYVDEEKQWIVLSTPGHTSDSICLYNQKDKILFSGDTLVSLLGKPKWTPLITDKEALEKSKKKIERLNIKLVYPGHGEPFRLDTIQRNCLFNSIS
ncbi:hypothetical protein A2Y99_04345 [Candidatus Gottesmanbacteria bacterium RBG_13_37_7]|uniref:Metallo-beta-lactamase domain-containing protein n=1 Tax=Candidatus Gottesmanbacteria bacterium RBG_13_37_7 TaxID=1798369 RepID=A0A1F5YHA0_9BACT|nr:MAG: hypothetical protein A2Y99_04345 [Candidatus Gottesmanbacteria bacterium RBG_13_37_7]